MLTKEECVVGAYVIGTWSRGTGNPSTWGGYITSVNETSWTSNDFSRLPLEPIQSVDNHLNVYSISFTSSSMLDDIFRIGKPPKKPKRIDSWSLTCQSH